MFKWKKIVTEKNKKKIKKTEKKRELWNVILYTFEISSGVK